MKDEERNNIYDELKIRNQVLAIIQRGRDAGIPERYLRIPEDEFSSLLCKDYHKDLKKFASSVYNNPTEALFKRPFIIIDGGNVEIRKKAGFAILFRMIACDRRASYRSCQELIHKFQTIKVEDGINRNQFADELKVYDIVMMAEFNRSMFSAHFESGSFFDEVLGYRSDHMKPTIITYSEMVDEKNPIKHKDCGEYFANFSIKQNTNDDVLRIRVKT